MPKQFAAVALVSYPLKRKQFIWMSLLPLVLERVPLMAFICSPVSWLSLNRILFGMAVMGMVSPYPDFYNIYIVLKQVPPEANIQSAGDHMFWFTGVWIISVSCRRTASILLKRKTALFSGILLQCQINKTVVLVCTAFQLRFILLYLRPMHLLHRKYLHRSDFLRNQQL